MSAVQPALTPDFAVAQREFMLQGLERELEATKKVLSAVPDSNRDFRLDPKSRTVGELAWQLPPATCRCSMKSPITNF